MSSSKERPNIFVIMTDQHSKHVLSCYGNPIVRTPNLDRLAREGMRFTNAYCPSPLCVPSRMSFMTSRTPTQNQVWSNNHILNSETPTWAHLLQLAGYETTLIGRMHFVGPEDLFDYYYDKVTIPQREEDLPESIRNYLDISGILEPLLPEERIRVARAAYFAMCEHIDRLIGQILEALDQSGLSENTLVLYTTDHGESAGEHGCWWKKNFYESSAGIPMIARWPGQIQPESVNPAICNLMDIGPTLAEVAGTEFPWPVAGRSLYRQLTLGSDPSWPDETLSEFVDERGEK